MLKFCLSDIHWSSGTAVEHMPHKQASGLGSNPDKLWFFSFNHQKRSFIQVQQRGATQPIFTKITCLGLHSAPWGETSYICTYSKKRKKDEIEKLWELLLVKSQGMVGPTQAASTWESLCSGHQHAVWNTVQTFPQHWKSLAPICLTYMLPQWSLALVCLHPRGSKAVSQPSSILAPILPNFSVHKGNDVSNMAWNVDFIQVLNHPLILGLKTKHVAFNNGGGFFRFTRSFMSIGQHNKTISYCQIQK